MIDRKDISRIRQHETGKLNLVCHDILCCQTARHQILDQSCRRHDQIRHAAPQHQHTVLIEDQHTGKRKYIYKGNMVKSGKHNKRIKNKIPHRYGMLTVIRSPALHLQQGKRAEQRQPADQKERYRISRRPRSLDTLDQICHRQHGAYQQPDTECLFVCTGLKILLIVLHDRPPLLEKIR